MKAPDDVTHIIVLADDDPDDRLLIREAAQECRLPAQVEFVKDGVELMDYLNGVRAYSGEPTDRRILVLLDLNMPRMDGYEALARIRTSESLRHIPVIVLSTSRAQSDVRRSYSLGASSYVTKPSSYDELLETMEAIKRYWMKAATIPSELPESRS